LTTRACIGVLAGLAAGPLLAQQPARRDTTPPPPPPQLEPITVTATRSAQNLFDVAAAVTIVAPSAFDRGGGYGLDRALRLVPGVLAQSRTGNHDIRLVIRGYGARGAGDRSNSGTSRGVRVLLDGIPETEPDGRTAFDHVDLATAERVEVVRSNGSASWGNAAGGVVNLASVPALPRFATAGTTVGGFGLRRAVLRGSTLLGSGQLFGSATHTAYEGWRARSDSRRSLVNAGLVTHPDDHTTVRVLAVAADNFFRVPGPLTAAEVAADPRQPNATYAARDERRHNRLGRLAVVLDRQPSADREIAATLFLNPKLLQRSERGTFRDFTRYHMGGSGSYRVGGALGERTHGALMVGGDAASQDGAILFYNLGPGNGRGDTLRNNQREGARNLGVYAQGELRIGRVLLSAAARWDQIAYFAEDYLNPALAARKAFERVTPKLGVSWRLGPEHSVYATMGGGIEAPAGNETDPAGTFGQDTVTALNPLLDAIRSTTYEVGTRRWVRRSGGLLRAVNYDAALYLTNVANEIVPYRGGRFYFTAGKVRRAGAELAVGAYAAGGLSLETALTLQRHRYVEYVVDSTHYGTPGATADYADNRVVGVPDVIAVATLGWSPLMARPVGIRLTAQRTGGYFVDDANAVSVAPSTIWDLAIALEEPVRLGGGVGLTASLTVSNLAGTRYIGSAFLNPDVVSGSPVAFEPGAPRALTVAASLTWTGGSGGR